MTCETDEANPTAEILWIKPNSDPMAQIVVSELSDQYNANRARSVLTVTAHRSLHLATYTCEVVGKETLQQEFLLEVACKNLTF